MGPKEDLSSDGDFQCHFDNLCSWVAQEFLLFLLQVGLPLRGKVEEEEEERNSLGSLQVGGGGGVGSIVAAARRSIQGQAHKKRKKDHEKEPFSHGTDSKKNKGRGKN